MPSDPKIASILPNKSNHLWATLAFTASFMVSAILILQHIERRPIIKQERELLRLNLQKARKDLGLNPDTGAPIS